MNTIEMTEIVCPECPLCGVQSTMSVPLSGFLMRQNGAAVQVAFPKMPMEIREVLISGTHPECWANEFGFDWEENVYGPLTITYQESEQ
jgi:hypothetical protein